MASLEPLSLTERLSRVSAPVVAVSVLIVTTVAAAFYRVLSPTGNGIVSAFSDRAPTFGDCLYFSIVTLTSLGYGDYRPVGYGRALAVTEVGFGLFTLALVVSKLASARDSTVLRMLYSSDQQRRVHDFAEYIQNMAERVTSTFRGGEAAGAMRENVKALQHALHVLLRYLRYQAHMHDFLNIQSARQLTFVFDALLGAATAAGGIANVARRYPSARAPVVTVLRLVEELAMLLTSEGAAPEPRNDLKRVLRFVQSQRGLVDRPLVAGPAADVLVAIRDALPPKPWPVGIHKIVADQLHLPNHVVFKAIRDLGLRGEH